MEHNNKGDCVNRFLPIHYRGEIPLLNRSTDAFNRVLQLDHLRDVYTAQWLASISVETAKTLTAHDVATWRAVHDDTTPYYRTGSRISYNN